MVTYCYHAAKDERSMPGHDLTGWWEITKPLRIVRHDVAMGTYVDVLEVDGRQARVIVDDETITMDIARLVAHAERIGD